MVIIDSPFCWYPSGECSHALVTQTNFDTNPEQRGKEHVFRLDEITFRFHCWHPLPCLWLMWLSWPKKSKPTAVVCYNVVAKSWCYSSKVHWLSDYQHRVSPRQEWQLKPWQQAAELLNMCLKINAFTICGNYDKNSLDYAILKGSLCNLFLHISQLKLSSTHLPNVRDTESQ